MTNFAPLDVKCRNEEHLLDCKYVFDQMSDPYTLAEIELSDVFGILQEQKQIAQAFEDILNIREQLISKE